MKEKIKTITIIILILLVCITNVSAITSNEVTYDNKTLTETIDDLYTELNTYKTGGTVTAGEILNGKTAYSGGQLLTGTMPNNGAVKPSDLSPGGSYTIPAGYHNGSGVVKAATDANLTAGNIKTGISIFGVTGTYTSDANATAAQILSGQTAYVNGSKVTGSMANKGKQEYTNLAAGATYTIPAGYHNGTGTVTAKTLASQTGVDSGKTAVGAAQMLTGYQGWVNGSKITGTMANNGAVSPTALNAGGSYTIPAGYHNGSGKVTATNLSSQTSATAASSDIASGKTAYVNGSKVTGTRTASQFYTTTKTFSSGGDQRIVQHTNTGGNSKCYAWAVFTNTTSAYTSGVILKLNGIGNAIASTPGSVTYTHIEGDFTSGQSPYLEASCFSCNSSFQITAEINMVCAAT